METLVENRLSAEAEALDLEEFYKLFDEAQNCGLNSEVSVLYAIGNM